MKRADVACFVAALLTASACARHQEKQSPINAGKANVVLEQRATRLTNALAQPADSASNWGQPLARWALPPELGEISGLALTDDGRLFAHNDESARITEIDYRRGTILKHFYAGEKDLRGDFESISFGDNRFFLMTSNGVIYEFPEGQLGERVDCTVYDTHLGKQCEFEGVVYEPNSHDLVLSCKNVGKKSDRDELVLYRYSPGSGNITEIEVPQKDLIGKNRWNQLRPTDLTIDPDSGNFVLVAAQESALIEITPTGGPVFARPLQGRHPQAEGIAITRDHILLISDESTGGPATITLYRWPGKSS